MQLTTPSTLGERRVYRREILDVLGISVQWFTELQRRGAIAKGHRDRPGGREWYPESKAREIIASRLATPEPGGSPPSSTTPSL